MPRIYNKCLCGGFHKKGHNLYASITESWNPKNKRNAFVVLYSPICIHCEELYPEIDKLIKSGINVSAVNVTIQKEQLTNSVPKMYYFNSLGEKIEYEGEHNFESMKSFIEQKSSISGGTHIKKSSRKKIHSSHSPRRHRYWLRSRSRSRNLF